MPVEVLHADLVRLGPARRLHPDRRARTRRSRDRCRRSFATIRRPFRECPASESTPAAPAEAALAVTSAMSAEPPASTTTSLVAGCERGRRRTRRPAEPTMPRTPPSPTSTLLPPPRIHHGMRRCRQKRSSCASSALVAAPSTKASAGPADLPRRIRRERLVEAHAARRRSRAAPRDRAAQQRAQGSRGRKAHASAAAAPRCAGARRRCAKTRRHVGDVAGAQHQAPSRRAPPPREFGLPTPRRARRSSRAPDRRERLADRAFAHARNRGLRGGVDRREIDLVRAAQRVGELARQETPCACSDAAERRRRAHRDGSWRAAAIVARTAVG